MVTIRRRWKSLSILPVPSTTEDRGSSTIETGRPVSSRMRLSRFFSSAPPPVAGFIPRIAPNRDALSPAATQPRLPQCSTAGNRTLSGCLQAFEEDRMESARRVACPRAKRWRGIVIGPARHEESGAQFQRCYTIV